MSDPNSAEFDAFTIRDDQAVTDALRRQARDAYENAFNYIWDNDTKTEWYDNNGNSTSKQSWNDWSNGIMGSGTGEKNYYSDIIQMIIDNETFIEDATEEELRELLRPPNDMGQLAQKKWNEIINEKNLNDELRKAQARPDTAAADAAAEKAFTDKCNAVLSDELQKIQNGVLADSITGEATQEDVRTSLDTTVDDLFSEQEKKQKCENLFKKKAKDLKRAAELKKAQKEADKRTAAARAAIIPAKSSEFKQQNFLQAKIIDLIQERHRALARDPKRAKTYPYVDGSPNASIMLHGDPATCINDLLIYSDTEQFLAMKSEEIANLQPEIRLYKTIRDNENSKDRNIEIKFDTHTNRQSLESLLINTKKRATGVGIKDFSLKFVGTDPFAANKSFEATLKIYAASFDELLQPRGKTGARYRYIDLALKTSKELNEAVINKTNGHKVGILAEDLSRLDFSIKVKLGLRVPTGTVSPTSFINDAITRNTITLNLYPTIHSFDFKEDGSLIFEIKYLPFNSQRFNGSTFDVFTNDFMRVKDLRTRLLTKLARDNCDNEVLDKIKKDHAAEIRDLRQDAVASIIANLHGHRMVNYLQVAPEVLETFTKNPAELSFEQVLDLSKRAQFVGNEGSPESLKGEIQKDVETAEGKFESQIKNSVMSPTIVTIPYVFISDIIDVVLGSLTTTVSPAGLASVIDDVLREFGSSAIDMQDTKDSIRQLEREYVNLARDSIYGDNVDELVRTDDDTSAANAGIRLPEEGFKEILDKHRSLEDKLERQEEIMDIAMDSIAQYQKDAEDFRKFRVVLGPIELVDPFNTENVMIASIGDIPVSLPYLQEFLTAETLKNSSTKLSLMSFLNRLIMKLAKNCISDDTSFGGTLKQKARLAKTTAFCINQYDEEKTDDLTYNMMRTNKVYKKNATGHVNNTDRAYLNYLTTPVLNSAESGDDPSNPNSPAREMNYLIFFCNRTPPIGDYIGNRSVDAKKGIHHYSVGRDRGIIKTIYLTRAPNNGKKEARFEQEGFDGLQQLREVYNVDVKSFANFNVFPGTKIFVDPQGWVPNIDSETLAQIGTVGGLTDFGIGGYYDVITVEHNFGIGQFDSQFTAKWVAQIESPRKNKEKGNPNRKTASKCKTFEQKQSAQRENAMEMLEERMEFAGDLVQTATHRISALADTALDKIAESAGGFIDRAADFFGSPSEAP